MDNISSLVSIITGLISVISALGGVIQVWIGLQNEKKKREELESRLDDHGVLAKN